MSKVQCLRCQKLFPPTVKLPLLCGCGFRHFDQSQLQQVDPPPGLPTKVLAATTAYTKWLQAGEPLRPASDVERIFAICQACPLFKGDHCGLCGCAINREVSMFNKIAMATEHCPLSQPKW